MAAQFDDSSRDLAVRSLQNVPDRAEPLARLVEDVLIDVSWLGLEAGHPLALLGLAVARFCRAALGLVAAGSQGGARANVSTGAQASADRRSGLFSNRTAP